MTERSTPRIQQVLYHLGRNLNVILQGPPGSGKTHTAQQVVQALCAQGQAERMAEVSWEACRWSHLARFMESEWLAAPLVWEQVQWHTGWSYEHLVRGASGGDEPTGGRFRAGMGGAPEGGRGELQDKLLLELARVAARREERALKRDAPCGPTLLILEDIQRGDLGAALGDALQALDVGSRGGAVRLRDTPSLQSTEPLTVSLPGSLWLLCTHSPDPGDTSGGLDPHLLRRFRVLDLPPDERLLAGHYQDYPDARRAARTAMRAVASVVAERPALMPGHGYWMVEDGPDWPRLLAESLVYDVVGLLRHYRSRGLLDADALRFESGPDVVTLPLSARHDQWLQVEHLTSWLLRLG
jgi:hypothetical protein